MPPEKRIANRSVIRHGFESAQQAKTCWALFLYAIDKMLPLSTVNRQFTKKFNLKALEIRKSNCSYLIEEFKILSNWRDPDVLCSVFMGQTIQNFTVKGGPSAILR